MPIRRLILSFLLLPCLLSPGAGAQEPPPKAEPTPLTVRVIDSHHPRDPDARVALWPLETSYEEGLRTLHGEELSPVDQARSQAGEPVHLQAPAPGVYRLSAATPGGWTATRDLIVHVHEDFHESELNPREPFRVRVVDPEGKPVGGALVVSEQPAPETERRTRRADDEGRVSVYRDLESELETIAAAPGFAPSEPFRPTSAFRPNRGETRLTLRLGTERFIEVRDGRDQPVPDALIRVGSLAAPLGTTDEKGLGTVWVPRTGDGLRVVVEAPARRGEVHIPSTVRDETSPVVVRLDDPVEIEGTVLDAQSREPLPGAVVWLVDASGEDPEVLARTDARGRYTLRVPAAPDDSRLHAAASGYLRRASRWTEGQDAPTLALEPAATVFGRVVDAQKRPVEGASLAVGGRMIVRSRRSPPTGAEGRFRITGLRPGRAMELAVTAPGFAPQTVNLPSLKPGEAHGEILVTLESGRIGFGRVLDAQEEPVAGARVVLEPADQTPAWQRRIRPRAIQGEDSSLSAVTGATGRFEISDLRTGTYRITVRATGFAPAAVPGVEVAGEAKSVDLGTVYLEPGVVLEGRVTDPTGVPLEGAYVSPNPDRGPIPELPGSDPDPSDPPGVTTDPAGRFVISDLAPGQRLKLRVSREGYAQKEVEGLRVPLEEPVEIVLQPGGRVAGTVVDAGGSPVREARVSMGEVFRGPSGRSLILPRNSGGMITTDEDGRFTVTDLPAGELFLRVEKKGFLPSDLQRLEIEPGLPHEDLHVVLERGATVTGRVLGPDGTPLTRAAVRRLDPVTSSNLGITDGDGRYRLEGVPLGPASVEARHPDYIRNVRDLEVEPGTQTLDFRLSSGWSLSGRVVDEQGAPVSGAEVGLRSASTVERETSDEAGVFRFQGLEAGAYQLRADAPGEAETTLPEPVVITQGDVAGIEIRLTSGVSIRGRVVGLEPDVLARTKIAAVRTDSSTQVAAEPAWDGSFTLEDVRPGAWRVLAIAGEGRAVTEEVVVDETGGDVELVFEEGLVVTGRVLRNGKPVVGAMVGLQSQEAESLGMSTTDAQGAFRLEGLKPGLHDMRVMHEFETVHQDEIDLRGDREILVELAAASVSGRVIDEETGTPLADVGVELRRTDLGPEVASGFGGKVTDSSGAFRFDDVAEGVYRLSASRSGYGSEFVTVTVQGTSAPSPLVIGLEPVEHVTLVVRSVGGAVPGQVHVAAVGDSDAVVFQGSLTPGEGGRVRLESLPEGDWELWVAAGGTASVSVPVSVPGPDVPVGLPPEARLRLSLPGVEGGLRETKVRLTRPGGIPYRRVGYGGRLQREWSVFGRTGLLEGLASGPWTVEATLPDGRTVSDPVQLAPGATASLTLE